MKEENIDRTISSGREPYPDLKALRESGGKTLKEISQTTRIRLVYLEAIESGQFQFLPESTYAESFIRAYAHEVNIDDGKILTHYRAYARDLAGDAEEVVEKKNFRPPKVRLDITRWFRSLVPVSGWVKSHLKVLSWSVAVLLVAVAVIFFLYGDESPESDMTGVPGSVAEKAAPPEIAGSPAEPAKEPGKEGAAALPPQQLAGQPQQPSPPVAEPAKKSLTLVITAKEMTWVRIVEDQNPPYQVLLQPGDKVERQAEDIFSIDVGNAGGIDIQFQGKALGSIGKRGEVVHLILPEDVRQN